MYIFVRGSSLSSETAHNFIMGEHVLISEGRIHNETLLFKNALIISVRVITSTGIWFSLTTQTR